MQGDTALPAQPQQWAAFAAQGSAWADAARRDRLVLHLADGVLALIAGRGTAEGRALTAFMADHDPAPAGQAALQAALIRHTEIDDIHRATAVTATAIALPPLLALAPPDASARQLVDALFVGQAVSMQAAAAMGGAALMARGQWPSFLVAPLGAAAVAGRLFGLPTERMAHALALALALVPRAPGRTLGQRPGRWYLFGQAVHSGCMAASAAREGIDGDTALLQPEGLAAIGGGAGQAMPAAAVEHLSIKPHCAAKQTLAAVHALQRLMADGLDPRSIERIEVHVPTAYAAMLQREPPQTSRLASMVSVAWQLALAALRPALLDDIHRQPVPDDPDLVSFAARVQVCADASLDAAYPAHWPARVEVWSADRRVEARVDDGPGDPSHAWQTTDVMDKARRVLGAGHPGLALVQQALALATDSHAWAALRAGLAANLPASDGSLQPERSHAHR